MRYSIESHPNRDMKTVHVDQPLFSGHFEPHHKSSGYDNLGPEDREMIDEIVAVPGVHEVYFSAYRVSVEKGQVFAWDEVLEPVLAILEKYYGGLDGLVEVSRLALMSSGPEGD